MQARRPLCPRCQRPLAACLCGWVQPTANRVPVLLLQHPAEAGHAKNSARLLQLSLAFCETRVGAQLDASAWPPGAALLYPMDATATAAEPATVTQLLVLDGTWRQTRQLLRTHPALLALPRMALAAPPPSRYTVRKAHRPHQRSTLEATCAALVALEGEPARYEPLLQAFSAWVQELVKRTPTGATASTPG